MRTLGAKRVKVKIGPYWETPNLHILLTKEDDAVVARCLDFTVSSHGDDEEQAIEALAEAIGEYILSAIENDSIGQINDPAPSSVLRHRSSGLYPGNQVSGANGRLKTASSFDDR